MESTLIKRGGERPTPPPALPLPYGHGRSMGVIPPTATGPYESHLSSDEMWAKCVEGYKKYFAEHPEEAARIEAEIRKVPTFNPPVLSPEDQAKIIEAFKNEPCGLWHMEFVPRRIDLKPGESLVAHYPPGITYVPEGGAMDNEVIARKLVEAIRAGLDCRVPVGFTLTIISREAANGIEVQP